MGRKDQVAGHEGRHRASGLDAIRSYSDVPAAGALIVETPTLGRVAVVTGGGSGIGAAVCAHLAGAGHRVAVLDRDGDGAAAVARSLGGDAFAVSADVADDAAVRDAFDEVRRRLGPVQVLVTIAAVSDFTPFDQITVDELERYLRVNVVGTFSCLQSALPDMVD